jgi:hypothetical protein
VSIHIPKTNETIRTLAGDAGFAGAYALRVTGASAGEAYTRGSKAGNYAAQILLVALQEIGAVDVSVLDPEVIRLEMEKILKEAGITDEIERIHDEENEFFRMGEELGIFKRTD